MDRKLALQALTSVVVHKKSLREFDFKSNSFAQNLAFNSCRYYHYLVTIINKLLQKDFNKKDLDIFCILLCMSCELIYTKNKDYAIINEWVELTQKKWACKLVNAIGRKIALKRSELAQTNNFSHPTWLVKKIQTAYPDNYQEVLQQNNQQAPMSIRIDNDFKYYIKKLEQSNIKYKIIQDVPNAVVLDKAIRFNKLPEFATSKIYIQDLSAIRAVNLMNIGKNDIVLDVCSSPGGKATNIANITNNKVIAVENNKNRLAKLQNNIKRMQLNNINIIAADATKIKLKTKFDKILIDAPCSATGIIRRQPDIKLLRKKSDINKLADIQARILNNVWQFLAYGGELLYVTCSILPKENSQQITNFLSKNTDAKIIDLKINSVSDIGVQTLPNKYFDGFYYAKLYKAKP